MVAWMPPFEFSITISFGMLDRSVASGFSGAPVTGGPYYKAKDTLFGAAGDINTKATKVSADAAPMN